MSDKIVNDSSIENDGALKGKRAIRSFVIREGRMTAGQKKALETAWPEMGLEVANGLVDLEQIFRQGPVHCEIGFGMGDSLFEMASQNPTINYVGIEVHRPGVGHLLNRAEEAGLTNLKVFAEDSIDVLTQAFGAESFDQIQIFFPDPWHKKKHNKRRLINPEFARLLSSKLKTNGVVHIATDWHEYAISIEETFQHWRAVDVPPRVETKYERRGKRLDHEVFDFAYQPTP